MASLLEQEIHEQPQVLARFLEAEVERVRSIVKQLPPFSYVLIAARGTSDFAATYAQYAWAALAGYPVALATPSLHTLYDSPPRLRDALVVGISQSGQSPDIVAVLEDGKKQNRPTLAITNDPASPLANTADHLIELHAGPERSVAATKTYTAQLAVMALLAATWNGDAARMAELQAIPQTVGQTLAGADVSRLAERYRYMTECVVIGRGYNYATSFELSLKLKELTYVMASAYSSADFRHGPIATVDEGLPVILLMPEGRAFDDMLALAHELRELRAELVVVSGAEQVRALAQTFLPLPTGVPEWLSPLPAIVPGQLLALHLALAKGFQPDTPRGLNKVTRTR